MVRTQFHSKLAVLVPEHNFGMNLSCWYLDFCETRVASNPSTCMLVPPPFPPLPPPSYQLSPYWSGGCTTNLQLLVGLLGEAGMKRWECPRLQAEIIQDPSLYVELDPEMAQTLQDMRQSVLLLLPPLQSNDPLLSSILLPLNHAFTLWAIWSA